MDSISLFLVSILSVISFVGAFDWMVYVLKNAPKQATLSPHIWILSFFTSIAVLYWVLEKTMGS